MEDKRNNTSRLCGEILVEYSLNKKSLDLIFENYTFLISGFPDLVRDSIAYNLRSWGTHDITRINCSY